jgi:hypothetical protein
MLSQSSMSEGTLNEKRDEMIQVPTMPAIKDAAASERALPGIGATLTKRAHAERAPADPLPQSLLGERTAKRAAKAVRMMFSPAHSAHATRA